MWYLGVDQNFDGATGYATSPDGITWTKDTLNPVLEPGSAGEWDNVAAAAGAVLFDGSHYRMWYDSFDGDNSSIGVAVSDSSLIDWSVIGVKDRQISVSLSYVLHPAYPNPFNPSTTLRYDLPQASRVRLTIYDVMGREVRTLVQGEQGAGYQSVNWGGTDNSGQPVSSGVYLYRIEAGPPAGGFSLTKKMVLLR